MASETGRTQMTENVTGGTDTINSYTQLHYFP